MPLVGSQRHRKKDQMAGSNNNTYGTFYALGCRHTKQISG